MKVAITYTVYTDDYYYIEWFSTSYVVQVANKLNYNLVKRTVGKHTDASRIHYHICCIYELNEKAKEYKVLNEKITRLTDIHYPTKKISEDFNKIEKKISFIYEGQQKTFKKKVKLFNESSLQYPFKEYQKDTDIDYDLQYGYEIEELHTMRKCANIEWLDVKRKQEQQDQLRINKQTAQEHEQDYINDKIKDMDGPYDSMIRQTMKHILQFAKKNKQSIRTNGLKDKAINYLYQADKITADEIIERIYI